MFLAEIIVRFVFEFIIEIIFQGIILTFIKLLGTIVRWCFFMGRYSFSQTLNQNGNKRVGVIVLIALTVIIYGIFR